jgi:hypothetical protein
LLVRAQTFLLYRKVEDNQKIIPLQTTSTIEKDPVDSSNSSKKKFYAIGVENEIEIFDSLDKAKNWAEESIELDRDKEYWSEDITSVEYGEMYTLGYTIETKHIEKKDDDSGLCSSNNLDYIADYAMVHIPTS